MTVTLDSPVEVPFNSLFEMLSDTTLATLEHTSLFQFSI